MGRAEEEEEMEERKDGKGCGTTPLLALLRRSAKGIEVAMASSACELCVR